MFRRLVFDRGSTDGTIEEAEAFAAAHSVDIRRSSLFGPNDAEISSSIQLDWARAVGADWALFLDADEWWVAAPGTVRRVSPGHL